MRTILSAMGRDALIVAALAFLTLISGVWVAPNLHEALALAGAASIAAVVAALRIVPLYLPKLTTALAARFGIAGGDAIVVAVTTAVGSFVSIVIDALSAPSLDAGKAVLFGGMLGLGALVTRLLIGLITPGETPSVTSGGITVPAQPIAPASLPTPVEPEPDPA